MRTKLNGLIAVSLASFLLLGCSTMHRAPGEWEYKVVVINSFSPDLEARLNSMGKEGWKLFTIAPAENATNSGNNAYIFQRRKH